MGRLSGASGRQIGRRRLRLLANQRGVACWSAPSARMRGSCQRSRWCRRSRARRWCASGAGTPSAVGVLAGLARPERLHRQRGEASRGTADDHSLRGRTAHAYDVRAGRYLGKVDQVRTPVRAGIAWLFALLPTPSRDPGQHVCRLAGSGSARAHGVHHRGREAGRHLRVRFVGPDGKERREYQQSVVAEEGKAELSSWRSTTRPEPGAL